MSNDVISGQKSDAATISIGAARRNLLLIPAALGALAVVLPSPATVLMVLGGRSSAGDGPMGAAESAMLVAASLLVWALLLWTAAVAGAALLTRLPGLAGRLGRSILRRVTPVAARNLLIAAVGASLVAGTGACAAPGAANPAGSPAVIVLDSGSATTTAGMTMTFAPGMTTTGTGSTASTGPAGDPTGTADRGVPSPPDPSTAPAPGAAPMPALDWPVADDHQEPPSPSSARAVAGQASGTPTAPGSIGAQATDPSTTGAPWSDETPSSTPTPTTAAQSAPDESTPAPQHPSAAPPATGQSSAPAAAPSPSPARRPAPQTDTPADPPADPPANTARPQTSPTQTAPPVTAHTVTVRPGDSLWRIAAAHLPTGASDQQIDTAWRAWYAANATVIGADPDLILPGQQLQPPTMEVGP